MSAEEKMVSKFLKEHLTDALSVIEEFESVQIADLLESLPAGESAVILSKLTPFLASKVCEEMLLEKAISILQLMPIQAAEHLLRQAKIKTRESIIAGLPATLSQHYQQVLQYSRDTVGAALNPFYLTMTPERTVQDALKIIKKTAPDIGSCIYMLDEERMLVGSVDLKDLITNPGEKPLGQLMQPIAQQALVEMNLKDLLESWDSPHSYLPVVDSKGYFLGAVAKESLDSSLHPKKAMDTSMIKAGNALGDVYLIGLTGLFGSTNPADIN